MGDHSARDGQEPVDRALDLAGLPSLHQAADEASLSAQRAAVRWTGGRLLLLLAAAVAGAVTWQPGGGRLDPLALGAAVAFFIALLLEVRLAAEDPERGWYQGRAAAESAKTLAWKYAVGGTPFEIGRADADGQLTAHLGELLRNLHGLDLFPGGIGEQITPAMRALRGRGLAERRAAYLRDRVEEQHGWYSAKSRRCRELARRWSAVVYVITGLGFAGALVKGVGLVDVDLLGVAAALVASVTAWTQLRQYRTLATAYAVTTLELGLVRTQLDSANDERSWADAVRMAEEAFSREHTLWVARRDTAP